MNNRTDKMQVDQETATLVAKYQRRPDLGFEVAQEFSKQLREIVAQKEARKSAEKKVKPAERQEWKPLRPSDQPYGRGPMAQTKTPINKGHEVPSDYASRGPFEIVKNKSTLLWTIRYPDTGETPDELAGVWTDLSAAIRAVDRFEANTKKVTA
jgi:hypothetical protein